jgi:hypothetical protein
MKVFLPINQGASNETYPLMAFRGTCFDHHHPAFVKCHLEPGASSRPAIAVQWPDAGDFKVTSRVYEVMVSGCWVGEVVSTFS